MKAIVARRFGGPEVLHLEEIPTPEPGPGEVRIAVRAAGTNPVDAGNRQDGSWAGLDVPFVPGYDVAGQIDAVGPGVEGWTAGAHVMAMTGFPRSGGTYAEHVVTKAGLVAPLAPEIDAVQAAAIPLAAGTAVEVLDRLGCGPGETILVLGASGGVGLFLLQLATNRGVRVIGVGRRVSHELMCEFGAVACIDYTAEDIATRAVEIANGRVDAIADLVGGDSLARALGALKPWGSAASIATPELDMDSVLDNNITLHGVLIADDGHRTARLAKLLEEGVLRSHVSHVLPLAEAARAHRILEEGHPGGKVVLMVEIPRT